MNYKNILKEQLLSELAYSKGDRKVPSSLRKVVDGIKPITRISKGNLINNDLKKIFPENPDIFIPIDGRGRKPFNPDKTYSIDPQRIGLSKTPRPRYLEKNIIHKLGNTKFGKKNEKV